MLQGWFGWPLSTANRTRLPFGFSGSLAVLAVTNIESIFERALPSLYFSTQRCSFWPS